VVEAGQAEDLHGLVDSHVGVPALAGFEVGEQVGVDLARGVVAVHDGLFGFAHRSFDVAQVGQREVDRVGDRVPFGQVELLRQVSDASRGGDGEFAVVGFLDRGEEPEQGGLAGAVVADDADLLPRSDGEGDAVEDEVVGVAPGDVYKRELGMAEHAGASRKQS
jgi:hypothetical protein